MAEGSVFRLSSCIICGTRISFVLISSAGHTYIDRLYGLMDSYHCLSLKMRNPMPTRLCPYIETAHWNLTRGQIVGFGKVVLKRFKDNAVKLRIF